MRTKSIAGAIQKALKLATASVKTKGVNATLDNLDYSL
jgi:hypothetical protein